MRSLVARRKNVSEEMIQKNITKKVKDNKCTYTPEFTALMSQISNIGQMSLSSTAQCTKEVFTFLTGHSPDTWVSKSTLSRWNKEVAELQNSQLLLHLLRMESWQMKAQEETRKSF